MREFIQLARERVGVTSAYQVFHMRGYADMLKPQFTRHAGLFRVHYALMNALNLACLEGNVAGALATIAQLAKAVHQAALDSGVWSTAKLLLPYADPLVPSVWGGTFAELAAASSYREGLASLRLSTPGASATPAAGDAEDTGNARAAAAKAKSRQRRKKDTPAAAGTAEEKR